jgi:actin-related protein 6
MLTNHLKEVISYRQWNMMDEFCIVNEAKEKTCYVSKSFAHELSLAASTSTSSDRLQSSYRNDVDFLLPDFVNTFEGTVVSTTAIAPSRPKHPITNAGAFSDGGDAEALAENDESSSASMQQRKDGEEEEEDDSEIEDEEETDEQRRVRIQKQKQEERRRREMEEQERQVLKISTERFTIPEVLFSPSYVGLHRQCGIVDAIFQSVEACPANLRAAMYQNILLIGGNAKIPNIRERIETDLRKLVKSTYKVVRVVSPTAADGDDPTEYSWKGAEQFVSSLSAEEDLFPNYSIDKATWGRYYKSNITQNELWFDIQKKFLYDETI